MPRSGQDAARGDIVRHLATGEIAYVIAPSQWGPLLVSGSPDGAPRLDGWERHSVEIIGHQETLTNA